MLSIPSASCFRSDTEQMIEKILTTGMPMEFEYKGKKFLLDVTEEDEPETDFRENKSLDKILQTGPVPPVSDISRLVSDFWPEDESADDFIDYIYQQRKKDIAQQ